MSQRGRDVVDQLRQGEDAIERLGGVLPDERRRILDGDRSAIVRRLEPAFEAGHTETLAYFQPRPTAILRPRFKGDARPVFCGVSSPGREPAVVITVTKKVPKAAGGWAVYFDVADLRSRERYVRRKPPAQTDPDELREDAAKREVRGHTAAEIEEARLDGNYTTNPADAVDRLSAIVDDATLNRFVGENQAKDQLRGHLRSGERAARQKGLPPERRLAELRRLGQELGIDIRSDVKAIERRLDAIQRRLGRAA